MKEPIKPSSVWTCVTCDDKKDMTHAEMVTHLQTVHKLETKGLKINRSLTMHLDAADSYHSTWEIKTQSDPQVKLINATSNPRKGHHAYGGE